MAATAIPSAMAQESGDLLTSQRREVQHFRRVPGEKIDHQGLVINPTPQAMQVDREQWLDCQYGFVLNKGAQEVGSFSWLKNTRKGPKLNVEVGEKASKKAGVEQKSGAYTLNVNAKGVDIVAYDADGAFYAMQTLRQLLESPISEDGTRLPFLTINDYPDLPYRGVVEGFYGNPWSHEVRLSLIDFYGQNKMNNYLYGPKDDPYHSTPYWRQPYPEEQAQKIRELVEASKRNHVDFVWAIHPGGDIRWTPEDYDSLVAKFNMMYDLGVRAFAIFFDDISGEGARSDKQVDLLNRLNKDFIQAKGDVANLIMCPTDYTRLWANPGPNGQLAYYGEHLDPSIEVFWTGDVVCSDMTPSTMEFVNSRIKRPALFWWNFPVTDYCRNIILQGPVYGLDTTLTNAEVAGFESNPMEHGEASKLALYGVADYSWNMNDYNPIDNWERGLVELMPTASEAYRTFAIHSADTETGYRRDESWETVTFPFNDYTPEEYAALQAELQRVKAAGPAMMAAGDNQLLLSELQPWLVEFEKLGDRGLKALDLIKLYEAGNDSAFWTGYVDNIMTLADREAYEAHKSGTMKLQPFYDNTMDDMMMAFYQKLSGDLPTRPKAVGTYPNLKTTLTKLMLDNDTNTFYTSANSQQTGHWIGLDLGKVRPVEEVLIYQGRNSVDDVDYFDNVILEASVDGQEWTPLGEPMEQTYIINWTGEPVDARFVRIRKLESKKQNWCAIRSFRVNPPSQERIGLAIEADDLQGALQAFDGDPSTTYVLNGTASMNRPEGAQRLVVLCDNISQPIVVKQLDAQGQDVAEERISTPYATIDLAPGATRLQLTGSARIYEIIPQQ